MTLQESPDMTANTNAARINARFTGEDARRFKELQLKTRQSASAVLREAVRRYHSQEVKPRRSAYEIMMESGLIGAFEGPEDLSTNKDKYLTEALRKKYPHHFEDEEPR
jgi:hypothetical protein